MAAPCSCENRSCEDYWGGEAQSTAPGVEVHEGVGKGTEDLASFFQSYSYLIRVSSLGFGHKAISEFHKRTI